MRDRPDSENQNQKSEPATCSRRQFLKGSTAAAAVSTSLRSRSSHASKPEADANLNLFFGDIHCHSDWSDGNGAAEDLFETAQSHLDFWALTDHAFDEVVFSLDYRKREGGKLVNDEWLRLQELYRSHEKNTNKPVTSNQQRVTSNLSSKSLARRKKYFSPIPWLAAGFLCCSCSGRPSPTTSSEDELSLVLAVAALGENEDGTPRPLPARMEILTRRGDQWEHRYIEDPDSNVFHKVMAYPAPDGVGGIVTLGGTKAAVKLRQAGRVETLWEADFGGKFSRMRDAEMGDIYGDGKQAIAVATHDQGVVAVLRPDDSGAFSVEKLDESPDTIVHEIELGDLDGDGHMEIYATPTAPNRMDGRQQPGKVVRYIPSTGEGRVEVVDLGRRHAKEILVDDIDGDGRDELYVSVEAVSGGKVEIRRYVAGTDPGAGDVVATLDDRLCRFLSVGDVDGNGEKEMVAATYKSGLWLLRPGSDTWRKELIAADSSGFEHASILLDLDGDGRDELYVASDDQDEVRRYTLTETGWKGETLLKYTDDLARFTWNITPVPTALLP